MVGEFVQERSITQTLPELTTSGEHFVSHILLGPITIGLNPDTLEVLVGEGIIELPDRPEHVGAVLAGAKDEFHIPVYFSGITIAWVWCSLEEGVMRYRIHILD